MPDAMLGIRCHRGAGVTSTESNRSCFCVASLGWGNVVVTAVTLFSVRFIRPTNGPESLLSVGWKAALLVGLAQGLAVFPGLSRSGLTIVAGLWGGMGRTAAAEFSFLLAVPTILAASLFTLLREPHLTEADAGDWCSPA